MKKEKEEVNNDHNNANKSIGKWTCVYYMICDDVAMLLLFHYKSIQKYQ